MLIPKGIIPAMITPLNEAGALNEAALRNQVRRFIETGVHGLFCLGTNGEFYALDGAEKIRVVEIVVEEAGGKLPVYAGAGDSTTAGTIRLAQEMKQAGADALSVITPYFLTFTQQELVRHYQAIADATDLPIVLYNFPARTGNSLHPKSVSELAKIPNIVGIKDSSGSYDTILEFLEFANDEFAVLAGSDSLILATLMAGGQGAIAATANVFPRLVSSIYERWQAGELTKAEEAQRELRALRQALSLGTLPSVIKAFLNRMGLEAGDPRLPVLPISRTASEELDKVYESYREKGLLNGETGGTGLEPR